MGKIVDDQAGAAEIEGAFGAELEEAVETDAGAATGEADAVEEQLVEDLEADGGEGDDTPAPAGDDAGEGEEDPERIITRDEDGATWNADAGRWQLNGRFVEGAAPEAKPAAGATTAPAAGEKAAATTPQVQWEPVAVTVDRNRIAIPEARVTKMGDHMMIAVPEKDFQGFQRRLARGVAFERRWQQMDQSIRDLEQQKKELAERPPQKSDTEIEADILLAEIKPHMARLFDEDQLEKLDLKVKLAQREERDRYQGELTKRQSEATERETFEQETRESLADVVIQLAEGYPQEFSGLTDADLREVLHTDLLPVLSALIQKDGDGWTANTEYIFNRLKMKAAMKATAAAAPPAKPAAKPAATTPAGKPDRADQFNRGQNTAAAPVTTNLKARRGTGTPPGSPEPTRERAGAGARGKTAEQEAEDNWRKETRELMKSDTLDF